MEKIIARRWESPAGELVVGAHAGRLCACYWASERQAGALRRRMERMLNAEFTSGDCDVTDEAIAQLVDYFAGRRKAFDVPMVLTGTEFQQRVWNELKRIPYGSAISYLTLSARIGRPTAARAVAAANAANPISIFVPCHRVIGSNGALTGYAGGLQAKRMLLELEFRCAPTSRRPSDIPEDCQYQSKCR